MLSFLVCSVQINDATHIRTYHLPSAAIYGRFFLYGFIWDTLSMYRPARRFGGIPRPGHLLPCHQPIPLGLSYCASRFALRIGYPPTNHRLFYVQWPTGFLGYHRRRLAFRYLGSHFLPHQPLRRILAIPNRRIWPLFAYQQPIISKRFFALAAGRDVGEGYERGYPTKISQPDFFPTFISVFAHLRYRPCLVVPPQGLVA